MNLSHLFSAALFLGAAALGLWCARVVVDDFRSRGFCPQVGGDDA